ncbi:MAG: GNAT family N-acetyltransferase [Oscillospiraceae bacterium]|nr:GNAT family N-acetyltransferase [Oscillospiraceae bacterium]
MDLLNRMNLVLNYIEDNLDGEIEENKIAMLFAGSKSMFQRIFTLMTETTLSEYIRKRRLTQAAFDIRTTNEKIIDIAVKYGYNSAVAFNSAFKRFHGISPSSARKSGIQLQIFHRLAFTLALNLNQTGGNNMQYHVIEDAKIIIRKCTVEDSDALKSVIVNDNPRYMEDLAADHNKLTIAEYNGVVAGYLWTTIYMGHCQAFIYVSPEYRRRGIGTALCHEAEKKFREQTEIKEMWGYYYDFETIKFIDKLGFYFTTSSLEMEYKGGLIPEQKQDMIRKCRENDFPRCCDIWDKGCHEIRISDGYPDSEPEEPSEEKRQQFVGPETTNYVLEEDGKIVGTGCIAWDNYIGSLAVDKEYANKGYGTALAIYMTNEILRRGHKFAGLGCGAKNIIARHIYDKIGYKIAETIYASFKKIDETL